MGDMNEKKLTYFPSVWNDRTLITEWKEALMRADEKAKGQSLVALPNYIDDPIYQLLSKIDTSKPDAVAQLSAVRLIELGYGSALKSTETFLRSLIKSNVQPKRGGGAQYSERPGDEPFGEGKGEKPEKSLKKKRAEDDDSDDEKPPTKVAHGEHKCDFPGCTKEYATARSLETHKRVHKP